MRRLPARRERRSWLVAAAAATALAMGSVSSGTLPSAAEETLTTYAAVGSAEGVSYQLVRPGTPLSNSVADVATPVAQSEVDSIGGSLAYAAAPYPGETVLTGPALAGGATGLPLNQGYPVMAAARYPSTPESSVAQPGVDLRAITERLASAANATVGGTSDSGGYGRGHAESQAGLDPSTGTLTSTARSTSDVIEMAGILRIGRVDGTARAVRRTDGTLNRSSALVVSDVTVAGMTAFVGPDGVVIGSQSNPLPGGAGLEALQNAGIKARTIEPHETQDGVVSGALIITVDDTGPSGPATHTFTFGRAAARVSARSAPGLGVAGALPAPTYSSGDERPSPSGVTPLTSSVELAAPPTASPSAPVGLRAIRASLPLGEITAFYLMLMVGALVMLGAGQVIRLRGVRTSWTS